MFKDLLPDPKGAPWADTNPRVTIGFSTRFPEDMHAKLKWLADNLPRKSIQKLVHEAVRTQTEKLIKEHYRPEGP